MVQVSPHLPLINEYSPAGNWSTAAYPVEVRHGRPVWEVLEEGSEFTGHWLPSTEWDWHFVVIVGLDVEPSNVQVLKILRKQLRAGLSIYRQSFLTYP